MKSYIISALLSVSTVAAQNMFQTPVSDSLFLQGQEQKQPHLVSDAYVKKFGEGVEVGQAKDIRFGHQETVTKHDPIGEEFEKLIELADSSYYFDYKQQTKHVEDLTKFVKGEKNFTQPDDPSLNITCANLGDRGTDDPDAQFMWAPVYAGKVTPTEKISTFEGHCFEKLSMEMAYSDDAKDVVEVTIHAAKPRSLMCSDVFFFGNTEVFLVQDVFFRGKHTFKVKLGGEDAAIDMANNGLSTFVFCENVKDELLSVFQTIKAFVGGLGVEGKIPLFEPAVPDYMMEANKVFLKWSIDWDLEERPIQKVEIDESLIHSGDWLPVTRFDGLDPMIMFGTGTHVGHSVMALWFEEETGRELYIIESQDAWYWPIHRVQRNRFSEWIKMAQDASFHVVHMPLSDEKRALFNESAAQEFFFSTEGLPYGYHNFLYGWIDTPYDNLPVVLPKDFVQAGFALLERFDRNVTDIFFTAALNMRLGTHGLNISEVNVAANKQGKSIPDLWAEVEQDGWIYDSFYHDGEAMVCSSYVAAAWKAGGIFGDLEINAVEFTPKDLYQLNIFNPNPERPQQCMDADPNSTWCQLLGEYRLTFPGFNTIEPYNHMDETCVSMAPDFPRNQGC